MMMMLMIIIMIIMMMIIIIIIIIIKLNTLYVSAFYLDVCKFTFPLKTAKGS